MLDVLTKARERFGEINGVIHAAGVSPGGIIQLKAPEVAAQVLAPKVTGTLVLDSVFKGTKLDFLILCSSLTTITGTFGMVDHCAANAFLDAFAHRNAAVGGTLTISVNWDTWLEVGQAAEAASPGLTKVSSQPRTQKAEHPLHDTFYAESAKEDVYLTEFSTAKHWVLDEHRLMGNGMIPGTAYLEMARAAFERQAGGGTIQIEKTLFLSPFIVPDGASKEARTIIRKNGEGFEFSIVSRPETSERGKNEWQEHVLGKINSVDSHPPRRYELKNILQRCNHEEIFFAAEEADLQDGEHGAEQRPKSPHEIHMAFGARWQNLLKRVHVGDKEWLAFLELPSKFEGDLSQFALHPSLMDAATGVVQLVGDGAYLPLGYERLRVFGTLPRRIFSYVKYKDNGADKGSLTCDVAIMDEEGNELVEIEGYTLRKIDDATVDALALMESKPAEPGLLPDVVNPYDETKGRDRGKSIVQDLNEGLLPAEGAQVFDLLLSRSVRQPQVITSTKDLSAVIEWVNTFTSAHILKEIGKLQSHTVKHPRPNVQNAYVEPRNELERSLADIWQDMLGIEQVGSFDNFFELGGDSLLATQLISRLGETFGVDLPLRTLFDAPVVADLTVVIVQKQAEQTDNEMLTQMLAEIQSLPEEELQKLLAAEDGSPDVVETIE
jgi:polyketide synthase PksJ